MSLCGHGYYDVIKNRTMNKIVQSVFLLIVFSFLLIVLALFFCGLGWELLFDLRGIMEYASLCSLTAICLFIIYRVYKLYFIQPKAILILIGVECCSVLLWIAFICLDTYLMNMQLTELLLKTVGLDGFAGDERGLNIFAVLCGIVYPPIGIGCLFPGLRFINKLATTKDNI